LIAFPTAEKEEKKRVVKDEKLSIVIDR